MKKSILTAVLSLVGLMAIPASADLSGASNLDYTYGGTTTTEGTVTWAVIDTVGSTNALYQEYLTQGGKALVDGTYLYLYQIDFIKKDMKAFSVSPVGPAPITGVLDAGFTNDASSQVEPIDVTSTSAVSWVFNPAVKAGQISTILWYTSNYQPTVGEGLLQDGVQASGSVPVPVPAPAALLLGSMGLGLVGWMKRRLA